MPTIDYDEVIRIIRFAYEIYGDETSIPHKYMERLAAIFQDKKEVAEEMERRDELHKL